LIKLIKNNNKFKNKKIKTKTIRKTTKTVLRFLGPRALETYGFLNMIRT